MFLTASLISASVRINEIKIVSFDTSQPEIFSRLNIVASENILSISVTFETFHWDIS